MDDKPALVQADELLLAARADQKHHARSQGSLSGKLMTYDIGGHDCDDAPQLASALYLVARDIWPHGIPSELVQELVALKNAAEVFQEKAHALVARLNQKRGYAA